MKSATIKSLTLVLLCIFITASYGHSPHDSAKQTPSSQSLDIRFDDSQTYTFSQQEKVQISKVITAAQQKIRSLLPGLPDKITVNITNTDRDFKYQNGVNGQTDAPGVASFEISHRYPGGIIQAVNTGLKAMALHEFHHLARGWTMTGNKFGPGMSIAAVNEGLAVVFTAQYGGDNANWISYPDNVQTWVDELLQLPKDASYGTWMVQHPDGRTKIGYRAGKYLIEQAMKNSGKTVIELSSHSPDEIIKWASK